MIRSVLFWRKFHVCKFHEINFPTRIKCSESLEESLSILAAMELSPASRRLWRKCTHTHNTTLIIILHVLTIHITSNTCLCSGRRTRVVRCYCNIFHVANETRAWSCVVVTWHRRDSVMFESLRPVDSGYVKVVGR